MPRASSLFRAGAAPLVLAWLAAGCSPAEPKVASDVPQVKVADAPDLTKKRPKGMPKEISAGVKLDPTTGRPAPQ